uniref:Zf-3CxxC domain-containing protein n=1 Tax=Macrostomum lignano TaxID=282301 RepID=A0A1I8F9X1_9PLAT
MHHSRVSAVPRSSASRMAFRPTCSTTLARAASSSANRAPSASSPGLTLTALPTLAFKYSSGCTACVKWSFDSECKTCNTPLCNFQLAKKITQNNLLCYFADDEANIGKKRVWCSKDAGTCYHLEYKNKYNENRYHAGCGKGWTGCKTCKTSLCNIPDSQRALAEPSSGVDFAALSQGQPAAVGRRDRAGWQQSSTAEDTGQRHRGQRFEGREEERRQGKAANQFDYDYDGCGDFRPTAAAVAAMALLCLWLRLPASTATDNNNSSRILCYASLVQLSFQTDTGHVRSGGIGDPHPAGVPDEGAEVSDIVRGGLGMGRAALPVLGLQLFTVELVLLMEPPVDMAGDLRPGEW